MVTAWVPVAGAQESAPPEKISPAEFEYGAVSLGDLEFLEGLEPQPLDGVPGDPARRLACYPTIRLEDGGEAYFILPDPGEPWAPGLAVDPDTRLALRLLPDGEIRGRLLLPRTGWTSCSEHPFTLRVGAEPLGLDPLDFLKARARARQVAIDAGSPGSTWLSYLNHRDLGGSGWEGTARFLDTDPNLYSWDPSSPGGAPPTWIQDPAILADAAERLLATEPLDAEASPSLPWEVSLPGVLEPGPQIDPLAHWIPRDQVALFFPSGEAFVDAVRHPERFALGTWTWLDVPPPSAGRIEVYLEQLTLASDRIGSMFHGRSVHGMAVTAGDLGFDLGTDIALLMEARHGETLGAELRGHLEQVGLEDGIELTEGTIGIVEWVGIVTPGRRRSAFLARDEDVLILTNSRVQLERWAGFRNDGGSSLGDHPELIGYRGRYPLGEVSEGAFALVPSDALGRWTSAPWRIARARGLRAHQLLEAVGCQHLEGLLDPPSDPIQVQGSFGLPEGGALWLEAAGLRSETYGTPRFIVPCAERLPVQATLAEVEAYRSFVREFESDFGSGLQPFGARWESHGSEDGRSHRLDVTVLPGSGSDPFGELRGWIGDGELGGSEPSLGTEGLVSLALPLDRSGERFEELQSLLAGVGSASLLEALGPEVVIFGVRDAGFWRDRFQPRGPSESKSTHLGMPIGMHWALADPDAGGELFEADLRASVEGELGAWLSNEFEFEWKSHHGLAYLRASHRTDAPTEGLFANWPLPPEFDAFGAVIQGRWVMTLAEELLLAEIDTAPGNAALGGSEGDPLVLGEVVRALEPSPEARDPQDPGEDSSIAPGSSSGPEGNRGSGPESLRFGSGLHLGIHRDMPLVLQALKGRSMATEGRLNAWAHLPILESLQRELPDAVPQDAYERLFGDRVRSPAGEEPRMHLGERALYFADLGTPWIDMGSAILSPWFQGLERGEVAVRWGEAGDLRIQMNWIEAD